jgi:predicted nucleic acid-binding protein
MLADSNLIIYAASGKYPALVNWFSENIISVSAISLVEVLGYSKLKLEEKETLEMLFAEMNILYPSAEVFQKAVRLRQEHSMSLGDALVAATALHYNLPLATHNTKDFAWIKSLTVIDPLVEE